MHDIWGFLNVAILLNQVFSIIGDNTDERSKLTRFSGCYAGCGRFGSYLLSFKLSNKICIEYCANNAYAFAATRDTFCGCTNSLLSLIPVKGRMGEEGNMNTKKSSCTTPCPDTDAYKNKKNCIGDNCCGGPSAYSTYATGKIDIATILATRIYNVVKLMKNLFGTEKSQVKNEHLHVKVVVKKYSDKKLRICEKSIDGVICQDTTETQSLQPVTLTQEKYTRETQHITPSMIKPLKGYQKTMDLTTMNGKLNKLMEVVDLTNTSNSVEAGFDAFISTNLTNKDDSKMYKWFQVFDEGFSFTGKYDAKQTMTETKISNRVNISAEVPKFGKGDIEFFQDYYDIAMKWKGTVVAAGKVELTWNNETRKIIDLKEFLSTEQRRFNMAGTLKFGDRRTISAVIKIQPAETGILTEDTIKDESKTIQIEPTVTVVGTSDFIDEETTKDDIKDECPKKQFKILDKCRHRFYINILHDKKIECESKFSGEEVCSLFCAQAGSLLRGKKESYTEVICSANSDENTTRDSEAVDALAKNSRNFCEDTFNGKNKFQLKSASGGYLLGGEKLGIVFEDKGKENWKNTIWDIHPTDKKGFYYVKLFESGNYLSRTASNEDDKKVEVSNSASKKMKSWNIVRRGENIELISWKGDSLHSPPETFKVTVKDRSDQNMEWKIVKIE